MSERWPITEEGSLTIRQNAPIDLKSLHRNLYDWAEENKYFFTEKNFTEKIKSHGKEFGIEWQFEKKVTPFLKFYINLEIWAAGMNPVKKDDREYLQGQVEITIDSAMELDWQNRWEHSKLLRAMRKIYIDYFKKQYFLNYAGKCWEETYSLHAVVKSYLSEFHLF